MKKLVQLSFILFTYLLYAQVGIGTTSPTAALDIATTPSGLPALELNPQTSPVGTASGQLSVIGDQLYLYDNTRGKWLSVGSSTFNFGREGSLNNINLEYAGDIDASGPSMTQEGTIVYVSLNSSGGNSSKIITLTVYNKLNVATSNHPLQLINGKLILRDFNINFNEGDYFRAKVNSGGGGNVNDVSIVLWTKWRK